MHIMQNELMNVMYRNSHKFSVAVCGEGVSGGGDGRCQRAVFMAVLSMIIFKPSSKSKSIFTDRSKVVLLL